MGPQLEMVISRAPEVENQQKASFCKAESLSFSVSKELASEDASISRYERFESDDFVVRRLRRRASGVKITKFNKIHAFHEITENVIKIH